MTQLITYAPLVYVVCFLEQMTKTRVGDNVCSEVLQETMSIFHYTLQTFIREGKWPVIICESVKPVSVPP